jgi:hypothetical protein
MHKNIVKDKTQQRKVIKVLRLSFLRRFEPFFLDAMAVKMMKRLPR